MNTNLQVYHVLQIKPLANENEEHQNGENLHQCSAEHWNTNGWYYIRKTSPFKLPKWKEELGFGVKLLEW